MATDPRVEAVRQALGGHLGITDPPAGQCCAEVVVAALDAYDAPKFSSVVHECCERPTEADLRERTAGDLESRACVKCQKVSRQLRGRAHDPCGYWLAAARIARGRA